MLEDLEDLFSLNNFILFYVIQEVTLDEFVIVYDFVKNLNNYVIKGSGHYW